MGKYFKPLNQCLNEITIVITNVIQLHLYHEEYDLFQLTVHRKQSCPKRVLFLIFDRNRDELYFCRCEFLPHCGKLGFQLPDLLIGFV